MKESFLMYLSFDSPAQLLSDAERGLLWSAVFEYARTGNEIELPLSVKIAFSSMRDQLARDNKKYDSVCARNRENGKRGGRPKNPENPVSILETQKNPEKPKKAQSDTDIDTDIKEKNIKKKFSKPTIDEIRGYCKERKNNINPEQFYDHYETNGWNRGKTPIKDWKACIRTWERGSKQQTTVQSSLNSSERYKTEIPQLR